MRGFVTGGTRHSGSYIIPELIAAGHEVTGFIDTFAAGASSASEASPPTNASGTPNASLDSISCPASGGCVAVGHFADMSGITHGLIESAD